MQAGRMLATQLADKYRYENCAIMALDDGGVIVGTQIAMQLHCVLTLMSSAEINLPLEPKAIAGITTSGALAYNPLYAQGELDEMVTENRGYIEQEKQRQLHELNRLEGSIGTIDKRLLKEHNIIVVSEGLKSAFQVDLAFEFLKPIKINKLIFAIPFASVAAVDRMHVLGDELHCLDVLEEFSDTNHYYDSNDIPSHERILDTLERIVLKWK
jgi:putative phosphoribosyl transferase